MQLVGTSFNLDMGAFRLRIAIGLDDRSDAGQVRIEDLPRLESLRGSP